MPVLSVGTSVSRATNVPSRKGRKEVIILNAGSSDEILRADTDPEKVATSATVAYNRGMIKYRGPQAEGEIWLISNTAATTVNYTEVF